MICGFNNWPFSLDVRIKSSQDKQKLRKTKDDKSTSKRRQNVILQSPLWIRSTPSPCLNDSHLGQYHAFLSDPEGITSCSFNLFRNNVTFPSGKKPTPKY